MKKYWLFSTAAVFIAGSAMAQVAPNTSSEVEEVVVTGSRIPRAGFDTLEPATTVTAVQLENRNATNVGQVLQTTPGFSVGQSPIGAQSDFSPGATFVDRFGLGSARTLTLVNGRRFVSTNPPSTQNGQTPGAQVDLNVISPMMVERIENLAIGGAPTYGTDAIAGVVNIILRKHYVGAMVSAQAGVTEVGDNRQKSFSGLVGRDFGGGRGNVMLAVSYDKSDGAGYRDWQKNQLVFAANPLATSAAARLAGRTSSTDGRVNPNIPFNTGATDGIPNSVLISNYTIPAVSRGGVITPVGSLQQASFIPVGFGPGGQTMIQFGADGNVVPYNPGNPFAPTFASGGDGYRNMISNVAAATERKTVNLNLTYDLTDHIQAFYEGSYFNGGGSQNNATAHYFSRYFGTSTSVLGPLLVNINDPRLTPASVATLKALGVTNFEVSKVSEEIGQADAATDNTVMRSVAGLNGTFDAAGRTFRFDASVNYGRTDGRAYKTSVIQQNYVNAMNVKRDASGAIVCDANPTQIVTGGAVKPVADAACVPLNLFGINQASQAALNYVDARAEAKSKLEETDVLVNLGSSNLFSIFGADPVGFNVGLEYRKEQGQFTPDPLQAAGLTQESVVTAVAGQYSTKEIFGETLVPLISSSQAIPLIDTLEFEGRVRYVDNSLTGGFTAYTVGGRYKPVPDIEFRGNYTRSFRAPSIAELYSPQSVSVGQFPDPCDSRNLTVGPNPAVRQKNCAAFYTAYGITNPSTFFSTANGVGIPVLIGGNPNLQNETATSYTFGVVLRPRFLPKFQAAVDWNHIRVSGNIAALTSTNIAQGCYDNPSFNAANPDAGNAFCTLFTRTHGGAQNGQLVIDPKNPGLTNLFVNGAYSLFQGLTVDASYRDIPIDVAFLEGSLRLDGTFYYLDKLCSSNNAVTTVCLQGTTTQPRYTAQLDATYVQDRVALNIEANYRPSTKFDLLFTEESQDYLKRDSQVLFNVGASYRVDDKTQVRGSIANLLDSKPPGPIVAFQPVVGDYLGRRYSVVVTHTF
jgi:outer membrane receptor protein involved in Fe transport